MIKYVTLGNHNDFTKEQKNDQADNPEGTTRKCTGFHGAEKGSGKSFKGSSGFH